MKRSGLERAIRYLERVKWPKTRRAACRRVNCVEHVLCRIQHSTPKRSPLWFALLNLEYSLRCYNRNKWEQLRSETIELLRRKLCAISR